MYDKVVDIWYKCVTQLLSADAAARIFLRCVALRSARSARRRRKYLIPMDLTVGQFVYVIRKRISIPSDKVRQPAASLPSACQPCLS